MLGIGEHFTGLNRNTVNLPTNDWPTSHHFTICTSFPWKETSCVRYRRQEGWRGGGDNLNTANIWPAVSGSYDDTSRLELQLDQSLKPPRAASVLAVIRKEVSIANHFCVTASLHFNCWSRINSQPLFWPITDLLLLAYVLSDMCRYKTLFCEMQKIVEVNNKYKNTKIPVKFVISEHQCRFALQIYQYHSF